MGHIIISFLFFNLILYILNNHYKKKEYVIKNSVFIVYIILFIIFGAYGGGEGDYLTYKKSVEQFNTYYDVLYFSGMEQQYVYLAYLVGGNYTLWRLILYSVQFIGFGFFLYKAKLNTYPVLLSFTTFCLVMSVYGRSFWGVIYFFMGVYLLFEKKNPLYLIAVALCYLSHTSEIILIVLLPLAFFNLKRWHFLTIFLVYGSLIALFKDLFAGLLNAGGFDVKGADYINSRLMNYGENEANVYFGKSIGETVSIVMRDTFTITILFTVISLVFNNRNRYLSIYKPVRSIVNISIGLLLVSSLFLVSSVGSAVLFYRVLDMTFFPVSIILPCLAKSNVIGKKRFNIYIYLFIIYTEFGYMRDIYYAFAGGNY